MFFFRYLDDPRPVVRESCEVALDMSEYENSPEFQYANTLLTVEGWYVVLLNFIFCLYMVKRTCGVIINSIYDSRWRGKELYPQLYWRHSCCCTICSIAKDSSSPNFQDSIKLYKTQRGKKARSLSQAEFESFNSDFSPKKGLGS